MKKKILYALGVFVFVGASAFVILNKTEHQKKTETVSFGLLPRKASLAYSKEWPVTQNNTDILFKKIKNNSNDIKSMVALASIYLQEARITGNYEYYNEAALQTVKTILEKDAANFDALTIKATVLLSQHRFEGALAVGEQLEKSYPYNAYIQGLLVDANVELGNYAAALEAADKMISIRPDIRSYSRIAYLREIHGDIPGAIDAMKLAVTAGAPGDENTEWCRFQMGRLYEKIGKLKEAEMNYTITLNNRENYPYGLIGMAGIAAAQKDFSKALSLYQQADTLISNHITKEGIAEVYNVTGETGKAKAMAAEVFAHMKTISKAGNEDLEMAHAYIGMEDYTNALEFSMKEYKRRPENIEVNETIAIIYYKQADYSNALKFIEAALKTNCKNPELLCYAGLINTKAGKTKEGISFLQEAMKNNPNIPAGLKEESKKALASLR
jgi:tetratricopeptide (TPR) repeat protein